VLLTWTHGHAAVNRGLTVINDTWPHVPSTGTALVYRKISAQAGKQISVLSRAEILKRSILRDYPTRARLVWSCPIFQISLSSSSFEAPRWNDITFQTTARLNPAAEWQLLIARWLSHLFSDDLDVTPLALLHDMKSEAVRRVRGGTRKDPLRGSARARGFSTSRTSSHRQWVMAIVAATVGIFSINIALRRCS